MRPGALTRRTTALLAALVVAGCTASEPDPTVTVPDDVEISETGPEPPDAEPGPAGAEPDPEPSADHGLVLDGDDPVGAWVRAASEMIDEDPETAAGFFYSTMHPDVRSSFRWCDTAWLHEAGVVWGADQDLEADADEVERAVWQGSEGPLEGRRFPDAYELPVTVVDPDAGRTTATMPFVRLDGALAWLADCPERPELDPPDPSPTPEPSTDEPASDATPETTEEHADDEGTDEPAGPDLSVALELTEVAQLDQAVAGAVAPDGTIHLGARTGTVHPLTDEGVGPAVVDVSAETRAVGEEGLLGLAFAPDGSELFVSYTTVSPRKTMIVAYPVEDSQVDGSRRRVVFTLDQPDHNHNGGDIHFGPDGMLYIGLGDGSLHGDPHGFAQNLSTPLGSILRIDPLSATPYAVPDDNPFVGVDGARPEIWVYGLRNPWRFSFDRRTGELWIGDAGEAKREEIDRIAAGQGGANLGWNLMEGWLEFAGPPPEDHHGPMYEYVNTPERCAVVGGHVYRGSAIPELEGAYLFSDFCEGLVRALVADGGRFVEQASLGLDAGSVVSFLEDADGELYVLRMGTGVVSRIDPAG